MGTFEGNFRPTLVKKKDGLIEEDGVLGYSDRIIIKAEELVFDRLAKSGLKNTDMENAMEIVQKKTADKDFIKNFEIKWRERLKVSDDPEKTEEELAKGLAFILKSDVDIELFPTKKAA